MNILQEQAEEGRTTNFSILCVTLTCSFTISKSIFSDVECLHISSLLTDTQVLIKCDIIQKEIDQ